MDPFLFMYKGSVTCTVPWLRRSTAGLTSQWPRFDPRSVRVSVLTDKVGLGQIFLPVLRFSPVHRCSIFSHSSITDAVWCTQLVASPVAHLKHILQIKSNRVANKIHVHGSQIHSLFNVSCMFGRFDILQAHFTCYTKVVETVKRFDYNKRNK